MGEIALNKIVDKTKCCGCTACASVCPKNCITMKADFEGFLYPEVDVDNCINCNACANVCPYINKNVEKKNTISIEAIQYNDKFIRSCSTSGGAFLQLPVELSI